jgi:hypothetical protein
MAPHAQTTIWAAIRAHVRMATRAPIVKYVRNLLFLPHSKQDKDFSGNDLEYFEHF